MPFPLFPPLPSAESMKSEKKETSGNGEELETAKYSELNDNMDSEHPYTTLDKPVEVRNMHMEINHNCNLQQQNTYNLPAEISKCHLIIMKATMILFAFITLAAVALAIFALINKHDIETKLDRVETLVGDVESQVEALRKGSLPHSNKFWL